jgi:hypothetical protein
LFSHVEGQDRSIDENADEEQVRLSSDVLFELNRADITPAARALITDVAQRIDASPGNTVKVDGHTDTSGNDAINEPLSKRRAQAVEVLLKELVTRPDVTYQSLGHGSKQAAFSNDTEAGRKMNRRVTVTFVRRKPTADRGSAVAPVEPGRSVATAQPHAEDVKAVKVEINGLTRDASGMTRLTWTLTNNGGQVFQATGFRFGVTYQQFPVEYYQGGVSSGVTLYDANTRLRYWSLLDRDSVCVCSSGAGSDTWLEPNERVTYFNLYKIPLDVSTVGVEIPNLVAVKDVAVA